MPSLTVGLLTHSVSCRLPTASCRLSSAFCLLLTAFSSSHFRDHAIYIRRHCAASRVFQGRDCSSRKASGDGCSTNRFRLLFGGGAGFSRVAASEKLLGWHCQERERQHQRHDRVK